MKKITVSDIRAIKTLQDRHQKLFIDQQSKFIYINQDVVICYGNNYVLRVYSIQDNNVRYEIGVNVKKDVVGMEIFGDVVMIGFQNLCQAVVCDLRNNTVMYLEGHLREINDICVYDNGFATASKDMTIRLWQVLTPQDTSNKRPLKFPIALKGHKGSVVSICIFGKYLISGCEDKWMICWYNKNIWSSKQIGYKIIKILSCLKSKLIVVMCQDKIGYFIKMDSIINKKIQIVGKIYLYDIQFPLCTCQLDQCFIVVGGKESIKFVQVNLMKIVHQIILENNNIIALRYGGRSIFIGEKGVGVRVITI